MRSFLFTLGFHEDFIIRRLSFCSARRGEDIYVFVNKPVVGGVVKAFDSLSFYCRRIGLSIPRMIELDLSDPANALIYACKVISKIPTPVVVELGGGMRSLVILVFLAVLNSCRDFELYVSVEGTEDIEIHFPRGFTKALKGLSFEKRMILSTMHRFGRIRVEDLARVLGKPVKTVRNHLSELKRMGLVVSSGKGAPLRLTRWGEIFVEHNSRLSSGK